MRKSLFLFVAIVATICSTNTLRTKQQYSYRLLAHFSPSIAPSARIKTHFHGSELQLTEQGITLPTATDKKIPLFSLIITPSVDFKSKKNNVRYLKLIPDEPFLWYDIILNIDTLGSSAGDQTAYHWTIKKRKKSDVPRRIPENAIILFTNPEFIESVAAHSHQQVTASEQFVLPTIYFKSDLDPQEFKEDQNYTALGTLDVSTIHKKEIPCICKRSKKVVISTTHK